MCECAHTHTQEGGQREGAQGTQVVFEVDSTCAGMSVSFWFISILQKPPRGAILAVFVSLYFFVSAFLGKKGRSFMICLQLILTRLC